MNHRKLQFSVEVSKSRRKDCQLHYIFFSSHTVWLEIDVLTSDRKSYYYNILQNSAETEILLKKLLFYRQSPNILL